MKMVTFFSSSSSDGASAKHQVTTYDDDEKHMNKTKVIIIKHKEVLLWLFPLLSVGIAVVSRHQDQVVYMFKAVTS